MNNPCCDKCLPHTKLVDCYNPACECHKSANCPDCHFEPENGHALTCSKYVPRVYKSTDYLKVKTTEYKPKGELTDDFSKTDNTAERHAIRNVLRQPPKKEPKLEFPKSAEEEYTPTFEELYGKQSPTDTAEKCTCDKPSIIAGHRLWCEACTFNKLPTDTAGENDLINGWAKIARTTTKSAETSTDTSEEWKERFDKEFDFYAHNFGSRDIKSFIEKELERTKQLSFEEGRKYTEAADNNTYMEAYEIGKEAGHAAGFEEGYKKGHEEKPISAFASGRAATIGQVKELAEGLTLKMNVDDYLPKVKAWNGTDYDTPFDDGYKQAKADLLDHLKTIE